MGNIHTTGHKKMTGQEYGRKHRKSPEAMRKWYGRLKEKHPVIFPDIGYDSGRTLTPEQLTIMSGNKKQRQFTPRPVKTPQGSRTGFTPPAKKIVFRLRKQLAVGIYAHAVLVLWDLWVIFRLPGIIVGIVMALLKHGCVTISMKKKHRDQTDHALAFALIMDSFAVYLHYNTFKDIMPDRLSEQMGTMGEMAATLTCAGIVAGGVWGALLLLKLMTHKTI